LTPWPSHRVTLPRSIGVSVKVGTHVPAHRLDLPTRPERGSHHRRRDARRTSKGEWRGAAAGRGSSEALTSSPRDGDRRRSRSTRSSRPTPATRVVCGRSRTWPPRSKRLSVCGGAGVRVAARAGGLPPQELLDATWRSSSRRMTPASGLTSCSLAQQRTHRGECVAIRKRSDGFPERPGTLADAVEQRQRQRATRAG
jgi:hypothetical protein